MVSGRAAGLVAHRPAEHPAPTVAHEDPAVVLGDAQCSDLGRVSIVLPVKGRVHGQLTPEHELPFPAVPWGGKGQRMTDEAKGAHVW